MKKTTQRIVNAPTTAETILVVDDCESMRGLVATILCRAGYRVFPAASGIEALRLARRIPAIDLLVSDIEMPRMRGDELAPRFAALHPAAGIVFVSGSTRKIETPARFEFLAKPFHIAGLLESVRRALKMRPVSAESQPATEPSGGSAHSSQTHHELA